jgi:hypothetical protein
MTWGLGALGELWITRNYWLSLDFAKGIGRYSQSSGNLVKTEYPVSSSIMKLKAGYKYLPLGFFYGPQLDGYIGYGQHRYILDSSRVDGLTGVTVSGIIIGLRGNLPLYEKFRANFGLELILFPTYLEEMILYGVPDSQSNYHLEGGVSYEYAPQLNFNFSLESNSNKANFKKSSQEIHFQNTGLKAGISFTY